jgi:hypothetical protein
LKGIDSGNNWPFVTLSSFQRRAAVARSLSGAVFTGFCHYVEDHQRSEWESFNGLDTSKYLTESYNYFESVDVPYDRQIGINSPNWTIGNDSFPIFQLSENGTAIPDTAPGPFLVRNGSISSENRILPQKLQI